MTSLPTYRGFVVREPRFVKDQLFVRTQYWTFLHIVPGMQTSTLPMRHCTAVCNHPDGNSKGQDSYALTLKCRFAYLGTENDSCTFCEGLTRCAHCVTDVVMDTKTHEKGEKAVVVTKWQAFGSLWNSDPSRYLWHPLEQEIPQPLESISAFFEKQPVVKYNDVLGAGAAWKLMTELCSSLSPVDWECPSAASQPFGRRIARFCSIPRYEWPHWEP